MITLFKLTLLFTLGLPLWIIGFILQFIYANVIIGMNVCDAFFMSE
jgi:hypothetical protein